MNKEINDLVKKAPAGEKILQIGTEIVKMLLEKNISYGNSALNPVKIFSKIDSSDQILIRIDDKLNRIKNAQSYAGDNDIDDLIGYLMLYKVSMIKD